jgi:HTH-type transcriptional regulator / antitoxin HigA
MIQTLEPTVHAWKVVTQQIHPPTTEAEYQALEAVMLQLMREYNTDLEPHRSLWRLIAGYMHDWQTKQAPLFADSTAAEHLKALMFEKGVSQYQLEKDGVAQQSTLSQILNGKRGISKNMARKLATYFSVSIELFL